MMSQVPVQYAEITIFGYEDPNVALDTIHQAISPRFLEQFSAEGAGQVTILKSDPKLVDTPNLLDYKNIVRVRVNDVTCSAFIIETKSEVLVDSGEESSEAITVSGNGLRDWLKGAIVMPEGGLTTTSPDNRIFSFGSQRGSWYTASDWKTPTKIEKYHIAPDGTADLQYTYRPAEWPDSPNAYWVWSRPYTYETVNGKRLAVAPEGTSYFRYEFTVTAGNAGSYSLFAAGDDSYSAFIDSALAIDATTPPNSGHYFETVRYDFDLTEGPHVLAFRVTNRKRPNSSTRNPAALIATLYKAGDADAGTAAQIITTTGASGWVCADYPAQAPGWNVGEIMLTLLAEARDRGVLFPDNLKPTFTANADSNGVAWEENLPFSFGVGDTYLDVVKSLEELAVDIWIDPDTYAFNIAQTRGTDKSDIQFDGTDAVVLTEGWNILSAGVDGEADLTNALLMKTDDGWIMQQPADGTSQTRYGKLESMLSTGVGTSMAKKLSDKVFETKALAETGSTYTLIPRENAIPFVDFGVGDWVRAPDSEGGMTRRRVMSIAITVDNAGNPVYAMEFDTVFESKEAEYERLAKLASGSGLGAGYVSADGAGTGGNSPSTGTGSTVTPSDPVAPSNLSVVSTAYWTTLGVPQARVTISWDPVSTDVNGGPIKGITKYEVFARQNTSEAYRSLGTVSGAFTQMVVQGLRADQDFYFVIRAFVSDSRMSDLSDPPVLHHTAVPLTLMVAPSNPVLSSRLGTILATWDGKLSTGAVPAQFEYVYAETASSTSGPWTQAGSTPIAGGIPIPNQTVGATVYVRLRAVDVLGRAGSPSGAVSIVVAGVATGDLTQQFQDSLAATTKQANDALTKAGQASDAAAAAQQAAADAAKVPSVIYSETEPPASSAGKLWIKPSTKKSYLYNTSTSKWELVTDPDIAAAAQAAADAKAAADSASKTAQAAATQAGTALQTANGKNTNWYTTSMPPASSSVTNDTWWNPNDGYSQYFFNGTTYVKAPFGASAIAAGAIGSSQLANTINNNIAKGISDAAAADQKAVNAASAASTAQTTANNAATAASTADSKAAAARTAADNAASAASAAQTAADVAAAKALSIANGVLVNPGAEFDFDGWDASAKGTIAVQTSNVRSGSKAWQATTNGEIRQGNFAVKPGDTWRFRWWIKGTNTSGSNSVGGLRLQRTDMTASSPAWADAGSTTAVATSDWTMQEVVYTIPSSGVTNIRARVAFANPAGVTIYFDDLELVNITDAKAAADAATAASNAATTANNTANNAKTAADNAATAAATAKTAADNAATAAANAQSTANQAANDVITAQKSADGKTTNFSGAPSPTPTAPKANTIGDTYWQTSSTDGSVLGQWQWTGSAWATRQMTDSTIANLNAGKLTAGFINVDRLQGNSINASKLSIGDFTNLFDDPEFSAGGWVQRSGAASAVSITAGTSGLPGSAWNLKGVGTEVSMWTTNFAQVDPGASYYVSFRAQNQLTGTSPIAYFRLYWYTEAGTYISYSEIQVPVSSWADYSGTFVAPNTARRAIPVFIHGNNNTGGSWWFGRPRLRRMNGGELIVDGSVTAAKMVVGTITAASGIIANAAISTAQIQDAAVTNAKISNLDAAKINTGFLDAGRIQTASITSRMMGIGDFKDYLEGSDMEGDASSIPWNFPDSNAVQDTSIKHNGSKSIRFATTGSYTAPPVTSVTNTYVNLDQNPESVNNITTWTMLNNTGLKIERLALTPADYYKGAVSAVRYYPGVVSSPGNYRLRHTVPIPAGTSVMSFAMGLRTNDVNRRIQGLVSFNGSNGAEAPSKVRYTIAPKVFKQNTWTQVSLENFQVPSDATTLVIDFSSPDAWNSNAVFIAATASMVNAGSTALTPYFDGSQSSSTSTVGNSTYTNTFSWNGTVGNSTSTWTQKVDTVGDAPVQPTREYAVNYDVPVRTDQRFIMNGYFYSTGSYNGDTDQGAAFELRDPASGKVIGSTSLGRSTIAQDGVWTKVSVSGTIPAGTTALRGYIRLNHTRGLLYADDITLKNGAGILMEDGSITAPMLQADSVTANALQAGSVQTDQLDAYAITSKHTITGALVQTASDGARTEMNQNGLRVVGDDGGDLVRLGYGVSTGMAIRDPNSAQMIPLANMAFGTKYYQSTSTLTVATAGQDNVWSGYTTETLGDWIAPSTRVMWLFFSLASNQSVSQNYLIDGQAYLVDSTDTSVGARVVLTNSIGITWTSGFYMAVKDVIQARSYSVRNSFRSQRTFSGTGTPTLSIRSHILMPL